MFCMYDVSHTAIFLQFLADGVICRDATNECDLPEHCSGDKGECPENMHKRNGSPCGQDGYCFNGTCPTVDNQCEIIWGYGELLD